MENEKESKENIENQAEELEKEELNTEELDEASGGTSQQYLQNAQAFRKISPVLNKGFLKGGIVCW